MILLYSELRNSFELSTGKGLDKAGAERYNIGILMKNIKIKYLIIAVVIISVIVARIYWLGYYKATPIPTAKEELPASLGGQIYGQIQNPAEKITETNPFEVKTNPFEETKTNPFKDIYKNPFTQ